MSENTTYPGGRAFGALIEISSAASQNRAPSATAVKVLAEYFEQWVNENGHHSFDEILGFPGAGKGKAPYLEKLRERSRNLFVGHLVAVLHAGGLTLVEASEAVSTAINESKDVQFRKNCRQVGAIPTSSQKTRDLSHMPPKSIRAIFDKLGGEKWARFAGYFGEDCDERRAIPLLARSPATDPEVQRNLNTLNEIDICRTFPYRSFDALKAVIPLEQLHTSLASKLL